MWNYSLIISYYVTLVAKEWLWECVYTHVCVCMFMYLCVCVCMYVCMYLFLFMCVCICFCLCVFVCVCICLCLCVCLYFFVFMCVYVFVLCLRVCVFVCVLMFVFVCVCIYASFYVCVGVWVLLSLLLYRQYLQGQTGAVIVRLCILTAAIIALLYIRISVIGRGTPTFIDSDNPASFSPHLQTRLLTYFFLYTINAWLLLCPSRLCHDWSMGSIPLVESIGDQRNIASLVLAVVVVVVVVIVTKPLLTREGGGRFLFNLWVVFGQFGCGGGRIDV